MITIVLDQPFKYNRIVNLKRLENKTKNDFALGPINERECVLLYRK
jgi:hypothetical protein